MTSNFLIRVRSMSSVLSGLRRLSLPSHHCCMILHVCKHSHTTFINFFVIMTTPSLAYTYIHNRFNFDVNRKQYSLTFFLYGKLYQNCNIIWKLGHFSLCFLKCIIQHQKPFLKPTKLLRNSWKPNIKFSQKISNFMKWQFRIINNKTNSKICDFSNKFATITRTTCAYILL